MFQSWSWGTNCSKPFRSSTGPVFEWRANDIGVGSTLSQFGRLYFPKNTFRRLTCNVNFPLWYNVSFVSPDQKPLPGYTTPFLIRQEGPGMRSFSSAFFNAKSWSCYPWINCKGSDTSLLLAWVHTKTAGFINDPLRQDHLLVLRRMNLAAENARIFTRISYSHGLWLHKCARKTFGAMHRFIQHYNACAFLSMHHFGYTGFAMKSKFHMVCHSKLEILELIERDDVERVANLQLYGCEGNEDMVGKLSRLSRKVSARLAS